MGILLGILFGLVAAGTAKVVMPGPDPLGMTGTITLGMAGALFGGLLGAVVSGGSLAGLDFHSLVMAMIGSLVALFSYRCVAIRAMV